MLDNYATHKHPAVQRWLEQQPRFRLHFTPTSSSWLNLIERWFREITDKRIRRGVFRSVTELIAHSLFPSLVAPLFLPRQRGSLAS